MRELRTDRALMYLQERLEKVESRFMKSIEDADETRMKIEAAEATIRHLTSILSTQEAETRKISEERDALRASIKDIGGEGSA